MIISEATGCDAVQLNNVTCMTFCHMYTSEGMYYTTVYKTGKCLCSQEEPSSQPLEVSNLYQF